MSRERIKELQQKGLNNRQIAKTLDVSTQYVWDVLNDYQKRYRQTENYKEYKRKYQNKKKGEK